MVDIIFVFNDIIEKYTRLKGGGDENSNILNSLELLSGFLGIYLFVGLGHPNTGSH